jgi:hypothetical protein
MNIAEGTFVKILLRSAPPIEVSGNVISWKKALIELSTESQSIILIPNPDIMMVSLPPIKPEHTPVVHQPDEEEDFPNPLQDEFDRALAQPASQQRTKTLANLKLRMNAMEKVSIKEQLNTMKPPENTAESNYPNQVDLFSL